MPRYVFIVARLLNAGLLLWALARHAIGYYTMLRLVTCAVCAYGAYLAFEWKQTGWVIIFGAIVLLFQPVFLIRMTRETWGYIDIGTAALLIFSILLFREPSQVAD